VNAAGEEDCSVLLGVGASDQRQHLRSPEDVDRYPPLSRLFLDVGHRVRRQPVGSARALEDPVQDRQELVDGAAGQSRFGHELSAPAIDVTRGDFLERH
jgi:hypothetical protein